MHSSSAPSHSWAPPRRRAGPRVTGTPSGGSDGSSNGGGRGSSTDGGRGSSSSRRPLARLATLPILAVVLLMPAPALAIASPASEQELTARIADVDAELAVLAGELAALEFEAVEFGELIDRTTGRVAQLLAQRDATALLHRTHLDLSHRRTTVEEVDAALDVLLGRSGVADQAPDWYRTQLDAMRVTEDSTAAPSPTGEHSDPATGAVARAAELPLGSTSASTEPGHLQLRYAVRASLVFAELQIRLDQAENAAAGPRRALDEVVRPAIEQSRERARTLSATRDELTAELARARERPERVDQFHVPVDGPHRISSSYGMRRHPVHGDVRMHHGIDLAAPAGTPVVSAAPGLVVATGSRGGYGRTIDIDHGDGRLTRYAHLQTIEVAEGDHLAGRTRIGTVGATGTATGPHLHFEVREHGRAVDPAPWLYAPSARP